MLLDSANDVARGERKCGEGVERGCGEVKQTNESTKLTRLGKSRGTVQSGS